MSELSTQQKAISLYEYLKELSSLKTKAVTNITDYQWKLFLSDLPEESDNIEVYYRDRTEDDENEDRNPVLLRITKPEFQSCPRPDKTFIKWLLSGWDDYKNPANIKESIVIDETIGSIELFTANPERVAAYKQWLLLRNAWQEGQQIIARTRNIFGDLYQTYIDLNRDIETMEVVVANGFLTDRDNSAINHPMITRRVAVNFDAKENTLTIEDVDVDTELYTLILQKLTGVDLSAIGEMNEELHDKDYHPLDRNDAPDYLKAMIHKLSAESIFSASGVPEGWSLKNRFLLYCNPVFIFRKRVDGTPRFIQNIIDNITDTEWVPLPIGETVAGGKIDIEENDHELTLEEQLAAVGGEDPDILLSKEANKEQLEIAQRIDRYNAVLVQGPPGTGKTHTIANLMGHFLAQGQSILVTSQTPKALQVLKDKVSPNIRPLCVSVLNDTNIDMERSIDGITSFMSRYTANELRKEAELLKADRIKVIKDLADTRKKIYSVINTEGNNIVYNGDEISPSKAAEFIVKNEDELAYIPGKVKIGVPLPLSYQELIDLYRSNEGINAEDERELEFDLPSPEELEAPEVFTEQVSEYADLSDKLKRIASRTNWKIDYSKTKGTVIDIGYGKFTVPICEKENLADVIEYVKSFGNMEEWMKYAAVDGNKGGAYAKRWETLIDQIEKTSSYSESLIDETFGKDIDMGDIERAMSCEGSFTKLSELFERKGKISKLDLFTNKALQQALDLVKINGQTIASKEDCEIILHQLELFRLRKQCASYWRELLEKNGEPGFFELDSDEPENVAKSWIEAIRRNLTWHTVEFGKLTEKLSSVGVDTSNVIVVNRSDNALQMTEKILESVRNTIPDILISCQISSAIGEIEETFAKMQRILRYDKRIGSTICCQLVTAIEVRDAGQYELYHKALRNLYDKYYLQSSRHNFLDRLSSVAPDWANAIRTRIGVHGEAVLPSNIEDAWKWKQYSGMISDIIAKPYDELQTDSLALSKRYRELTGEYAEKMAWYHLLKRTENDIDMKQALNGWRLTVRKIGKGTGKSAPKYKAKARELMAKCQNAVPAWIMPMSRVIESLDPRANQFDVVIVDEASQSDVTALGVMYLAKKVIIVGDDKQVSPMAIGTDQERMDALESMYIKDKIPNSHLYSATTSLYDIVATTYQPLMLREHFRCVPEIIGFSNMLSYDYKIKPLRDAGSSTISPAVVNYRVEGGERIGKRNPEEAKTIVALMKACIDQPEYQGKTFGVISLLGEEQAKYINSLIYKHIGPQEIEGRKILCGNPSHFQGDERDIIFLSVVDSNSGNGPLAKQEYGPGEAYRKRYNVAASRAKDQLWVVDSLDAANDLKPGDIRKRLIEYSQNPKAFANSREEIEKKADSPFEIAVASELTARGYKIIQQQNVGSYRIDMVVVCGNKHIAIECDGERYHSGEAKIREDMERQTILERVGWSFIRIRGSEYYKNPKSTIERVLSELESYGIEPELQLETNEERSSELLDRVKISAVEILESFDEDEPVSADAIRSAFSATGKSVNGMLKKAEQVKLLEQMSFSDIASEKPQALKVYPDKVGDIVQHNKFGQGTVISIGETKISVDFGGQIKTMAYPVIFDNGICHVVTPVKKVLTAKDVDIILGRTPVVKEELRRQCENCMLFIREDCAGLKNPNECPDYQERISSY